MKQNRNRKYSIKIVIGTLLICCGVLAIFYTSSHVNQRLPESAGTMVNKELTAKKPFSFIQKTKKIKKDFLDVVDTNGH